MWATITKPFGLFMMWLYEVTGNYGLAIILFALAVNIVLSPFMAKSKKGMMRTTRLQPQMQELQARHAGNPQQLQREMQELYRENGASPTSGCLWSLIPFPILIALYSVIRQPITRMMYASADVVAALTNYFANETLSKNYAEISLSNLAHQNWADVTAALGSRIEGLKDIDFGFLGLNLGDQPQWNMLWTTDYSDVHVWLPALGLFLIPFISAALSWLTMKVSNMANPQADTQQNAQMKSMTMMMPLMSVWFCFIMPAAMGVYWIANSVFGMARDYVLTKHYKKKLDEEDAVRIAAKSAREKELEEKRLETERLKAEGKTVQNTSTSKKKLQANEKQRLEERKAALDKADRAAKRERLGITEEVKPDSQVGARRYARGRAYVADRFTNPEQAEAATIAAAEESEGAASIDETVADDVAVEAEVAEETIAEETGDNE